MLIDWFTVAAQVVNFIILVLLLRRFLYRPILNAIEARKEKIAQEMDEAKKQKKEAEDIKAEYEKKNREFDQERSEKIAKAMEEVKAERKRRMKEVKEETEAQRERLVKSFEDEQKNIQNQITRKAREEVLSLAQKTLNDLASEQLESHVIDEFLKQLKEAEPLASEQRAKFLNSAGNDRFIVRTAFELSAKQQQEITRVLAKILDRPKIEPEFEVKPHLICGVEVQINQHKLDWNFSGYLEAIEQEVEPQNA
ncbi:hypothetical protein GCM10027347_32710 [Larkinella harenae]